MMHILKNVSLTISDFLKNITRSLISSFGILFLISFLVLYLSFRDSIKNYVETNIFGKLAINEIKIYPATSDQSGFFSTASSVTSSIGPDKVARVRKLNGIGEIFSIIRLDYDTRIRGEVMGQSSRIHVPVFGVDRYFFKGKNPYWKDFRTREPLPMIAPRFVFEMLNNYLSLVGMTGLSPQTFRGFPLQLFIFTEGRDGKKNRYIFPAEAHSFTDVLNLPGSIVPLDFIVNFAKKQAKDSGTYKKGYKYVMLIAMVPDIKKLPEVTAKVKRLGLMVESQEDIAKKTNRVLEIIDDSSLVIIGILLILTVISIFNSYLSIVYHRTHKFSLRRVLGVSKIRIILNFVGEAAFIGAIYGVIGYYLGNYLLDSLARYAANWVPALKNIMVKQAGHNILLLAIALSALISSISALIPAIFASNINLFKSIKK